MGNEDRNVPVAGNPAGHWASHDPENQPARENVIGLPRLVVETRVRLGPDCTPQQVHADIQGRGMKVTLNDVEECWQNPDGSCGHK